MKSKIGVLLVNLGTPRTPTVKDVFTYLNEFLMDERVVDLPWLQRLILVRGIIVPTRVFQSTRQYKSVWTDMGSPLYVHSMAVKEKLQNALGDNYHVELGMRYQYPLIEKALDAFKDFDEVIVLPLFPQYASATTGSVHQKIMDYVKNWTNIPKMTLFKDYYDHPLLIQAFCERAKEYPLEEYDHILFSFHGLPERQIKKADTSLCCLKATCCAKVSKENHSCYRAQCFATAQGIITGLQLKPENYTICFQSRLGNDPWIQPYVTDEIVNCASRGVKRLLVFCPSFVCDCLETIFEIQQEYEKEFIHLGGEKLQLVQGLNDHPVWIEALKQMVNQK